jgi:dihydroneopterin aldolase
MPSRDTISIRSLRAASRIGVPPEERATLQTLEIDADLEPAFSLTGLGDDFSKTIDYAEAAILIREIAAKGERQLIETLAEDIARALLEKFPLAAARIEIRKFILPGVGYVSVSLRREGKGV